MLPNLAMNQSVYNQGKTISPRAEKLYHITTKNPFNILTVEKAAFM